MKELKDIVASFEKAQKQQKQTALATVVHVEGSSYRKPGARMLVTEDGELTGAISGGCLEGDALRKARLAMMQQKPMLVAYDTMDEDDAKLGVGLGCNGIIHILIEPILHPVDHNSNPISLLKDFLSERQTAVLVTLFSFQNKRAAQPGTCLLVKEGHPVAIRDPGYLGYTLPLEELIADANQALKTRISRIKTYPGERMLTGFIERIEPPVSLFIFGAGNDAIPLTEMAAVLGWEITVADGRSGYALPGRFPAARVLRSRPEQALEWMQPDQRTAVVLMTHNYQYDLAMLTQLLPLELPYIGSLGPKKKLDRMLGELQEEGIQPNPEQLQNLYGPTGLDIGAEGPEEIALSILSEIKAVFSGRPGTSLREKLKTGISKPRQPVYLPTGVASRKPKVKSANMENFVLFYFLLFAVAFLYASVGHGGASGYLALMAIFSVTPDVMKPTALLLNLFVSLTSFIQFNRGKHFIWTIFLPFALASIPLSFLGGSILVDGTIYKKVLGLLLLIPIIRFLFFSNIVVSETKRSNPWLSLGIGGVIGFLSGLIGIGGGIILSPVLLLLKWTDLKQTAAISALFIFVNSSAGLAGQLTKGVQFSAEMLAFVVIAFAGGLLGAYFGAHRFKYPVLQHLLGLVLVLASLKLLFTNA